MFSSSCVSGLTEKSEMEEEVSEIYESQINTGSDWRQMPCVPVEHPRICSCIEQTGELRNEIEKLKKRTSKLATRLETTHSNLLFMDKTCDSLNQRLVALQASLPRVHQSDEHMQEPDSFPFQVETPEIDINSSPADVQLIEDNIQTVSDVTNLKASESKTAISSETKESNRYHFVNVETTTATGHKGNNQTLSRDVDFETMLHPATDVANDKYTQGDGYYLDGENTMSVRIALKKVEELNSKNATLSTLQTQHVTEHKETDKASTKTHNDDSFNQTEKKGNFTPTADLHTQTRKTLSEQVDRDSRNANKVNDDVEYELMEAKVKNIFDDKRITDNFEKDEDWCSDDRDTSGNINKGYASAIKYFNQKNGFDVEDTVPSLETRVVKDNISTEVKAPDVNLDGMDDDTKHTKSPAHEEREKVNSPDVTLDTLDDGITYWRSLMEQEQEKASNVNLDTVDSGAKYWRSVADEEQKDARRKIQDLKGAHSVICLDTSGSISVGDAWKRTCSFVTDFINGLVEMSGMTNLETERVALVTFGNETKVQRRLTKNYHKVLKRLDDLTVGGPSQMFGGLMMTLAAAHSSRHTKVKSNDRSIFTKLILVTDGRPTQTYLNSGSDQLDNTDMDKTKAMILQAMETIRNNGHDLFVVPVGNIDLEFLHLMVSFAEGELIDFTSGRQLSRRQYLAVNIKGPMNIMTNKVVDDEYKFTEADREDMLKIIEKNHRYQQAETSAKKGRERGKAAIVMDTGNGNIPESFGYCNIHGPAEQGTLDLENVVKTVPGLTRMFENKPS